MTGLPRWADAALAVLGLVATLPLMAGAALAIKLTSRGPALFRQTRVGRDGKSFTLYKLRSMRVAADEAAREARVTARGDHRITPLGRWLRRSKVDELPQLWNVVRGDLALVGPRPEVPALVDPDQPPWPAVLSARPGITDPVTLRLRGEEALLAQLAERTGEAAETVYRRHLQPWKLRGYAAYLAQRSAWDDVLCLLATVGAPLGLSFGLVAEPVSADEILGPVTTYTDEDV